MSYACIYIFNLTLTKLELMFMKHYAPNRCLYIKVAKLRTGVGSAEMSHLQNRCLNSKNQGRCEQRSEGGGGGGRGWGGHRVDVNKVFVKIKKKKKLAGSVGGGGGGGGSGWM